MSNLPVAPEPPRGAVGGAAAVHDATVDGELELVARLVAAVAMLARPLTDAELDEILLP
ncbi:hypothetical protein FB554_2608 [Barrientosiimonas humi]|uniref:Uncharacterized protein n=2 Tax=Barrientosiimonas TaxID=1535207 RepID=A0A542XF50_9MICO|nr:MULTISPECIES: hypothetical protein [Barrientosiimonas]TQL34438.1 hypothetical protein FB554_2608 [Barrientosiimonas humi]BDZ59505.1 hypothetical protein GCM10025872_31620 [Barrientosiimonas endolithica]CAG7574427.1 hypothetical protein BH39T_PBIAJDOK_03078 [Barrientosiimonas humi]